MTRLPIIRPDITFDEVQDDLRAIFDSGILTSAQFTQRFEERLAALTGARHAVATTSATTALHLALRCADIGPGDEVLVSDFTFPASGNVILETGATPVLVDSLSDSFALDVEVARSLVTERTRAILPVDPFGQPADLFEVHALASDHGLSVIEDAACALGARRADRPCGSWSGATCFSFHPRKVVTTGEGGALTTDDDELAERARLLRSHGGRRSEVGLEFVAAGFNYRLGEIPAAIGLRQLARLDEILSDRAATAARYGERLAQVDRVRVPGPGPDEVWTYQSYVVVLDDGVDRNAVIRRLGQADIETTLGTYAMHAHPAFAHLGYQPGDCPNALRWQRQTLTLPLTPRMPEADIDRVVAALRDALG